MKRFIHLVFQCLVLVTTAQAADLTGIWLFSAETDDGLLRARLTLQATEPQLSARMNIDRHFLEGSGVVQGDFKDTIMALMAERVAIDLEELAILGDTGSGDAYLALLDGFLVAATSNIVDQGAAVIVIEDVTQQRVADESRSAFVTQVTHELRAPLTNIRLCAETVIDDNESDETNFYVVLTRVLQNNLM